MTSSGVHLATLSPPDGASANDSALGTPTRHKVSSNATPDFTLGIVHSITTRQGLAVKATMFKLSAARSARCELCASARGRQRSEISSLGEHFFFSAGGRAARE